MPTRICPSCNKKVSISRNTCPHCQYVFNDKICPDCNEVLDIQVLECPTCGYIFSNLNVPTLGFGVGINPTNNASVKVEKIKTENKNEKAAEFLICPQCGSSEIEMISPTEGYCKYCHTKVYKKQETNINTKNITIINGNIDETRYENKYRIVPSFSKEYILKCLLTKLVEEDSPLEALDVDFDSLELKEPTFIESSKVFQVSFQAKIGTDKQESYIAYETYYERVPVSSQNGVRYESVLKERPVTRYKNIIDWSPVASTLKVETNVLSANEEDYEYYRKIVSNGLDNINDDSLKEIDDEITTSDYASKCINLMEENAIKHDIYNTLHGDHIDKIDFEITSTIKVEDTYYITPIYFLYVNYKGQQYKKYVCPIGNSVNIQGDKIIDEYSIDAYTKEKTTIKNDQINNYTSVTKKEINKRRTLLLLPSALLVLFMIIILSITSSIAWLNIMLICLSIVVFIVCGIFSSKFAKEKNNELQNIIRDLESNYSKDVNNFASQRKEKLNSKLEAKLEELGIKNVID